jgi:hypothetical protein
MAIKKSPIDKLKTKLKKIATGPVKDDGSNIKLKGKVLFSYNLNTIKYSQYRYFPTKKDSLVQEDYDVVIPLNHYNLKYVSGGNTNPPNFARNIVKIFRDLGKNIKTITIGADKNGINNFCLSITSSIYDDFIQINKEESKDKAARFRNRIKPYLKKCYGIKTSTSTAERDYGLLLKEIINSNAVTQQDIISLSAQLSKGNSNNVVIQKQVTKQVEWLINTIEEIIKPLEINLTKARNSGNKHFGYPKTSISGAEHLMEKILTDYGQYTLFGVPALLNTNKYVQHSGGLSRSQFDLVLVNHLGEIEVVELKRPDKNVLDFDSSRNKFYPSKDLSIAISQAERYISCVINDNDEDFKIDGKKIRDYLKEQLGNKLFKETVRPSALIILGSKDHIYEKYEKLSSAEKKKTTKAAYVKNGDMAYRELKSTFRNINILTYSELLDHARTRLQIAKKIK